MHLHPKVHNLMLQRSRLLHVAFCALLRVLCTLRAPVPQSRPLDVKDGYVPQQVAVHELMNLQAGQGRQCRKVGAWRQGDRGMGDRPGMRKGQQIGEDRGPQDGMGAHIRAGEANGEARGGQGGQEAPYALHALHGPMPCMPLGAPICSGMPWDLGQGPVGF